VKLNQLDRRTFCRRTAAGVGGIWLGSNAFAAGPDEDTSAKPLPFVDGSFTIAVLPDTQIYSLKYPQHYLNQTQWIVDNAKKFNIRHVLHLGDITDRNTVPEWEVAAKAMGTLDGKVSYTMVPGNHDYGPGGTTTTRDTLLNDSFSFATYSKQKDFGGALDDGRIENSYSTFEAGGKKYLVIGLEWSPRERAIEWANTLASAHKDHEMILITHAFVYHDESRYDWKKFGKKQSWNPYAYPCAKVDGGATDGEDLWQKLVSRHNFIMTFNGHVLGDGLGRVTSPDQRKRDVHQMLVNYQMKKEGGEAFMRLVEFLPDGKTVQIKAYSPSLNQFKTDPQNQFTLTLDA
jgi:3',5'-cyclic AMP phosphodiesterase CpdA